MLTKAKVFLVVFLMLTCPAFGSQHTDSLHVLADTTSNDSIKGSLYAHLALLKILFEHDTVQAIELLNKAKQVNNGLDNGFVSAKIKMTQGLYILTENYPLY